MREAVDGLVRQLGGIEHIEVQEERRVQRGGAIVRSTAGEIDARVQTKLDKRARDPRARARVGTADCDADRCSSASARRSTTATCTAATAASPT